MKLTIEPGVLAAAVKFTARALTARPAYPALGGLKISAPSGGTAEVSACSYGTCAAASIPAEAGEPGTVLVPGRLLADITARLPHQKVELATEDDGLALACGSTRYTLPLFPLEDYPALPELPGPAGHADPADFTAAVGQVAVAAARDDTVPALGAVQATFTPDAVMLAATDRYRAALRRLAWQPANSPVLPPPVLIPAPALTEAAKAATGAGDQVSLHVISSEDGTPVMAGFGCAGQVITTRLIEGEYPGIAKLIPGEFSATAVADAAELAAAVKRLAVVAARDTAVRLAFTNGQAELETASGEDTTGVDMVACELDGDPITIAFGPGLLLDALAATGPGRIRIALTSPVKPALITPADDGDTATGSAYRHLLMPVRTSG